MRPSRIWAPITSNFTVASLSRLLLRDRRFLHKVEFWELFRQVCVAFALNPALRRTGAARGAFAVFGVKLVHHIHSGNYLAEGREALVIKERVVLEVNKHLGRARIRA